MNMMAVVSSNVAAVGYEPVSGTLRVQFHSGHCYDYYEVSPTLYSEMLKPHPWRRVGRIVMAHKHKRVA